MPSLVKNTQTSKRRKKKLIISGRGNVALAAEFNFWADPIAAHIILNTLKCPMTVLTFECGLEESISLSKVGK